MTKKIIGLAILVLPTLFASPRLRISTATIGPVNVAIGTNGPLQTVGIQNIGDGTLNLTATVSVTWLATTVLPGSLQISLQTASLARGTYTSIVNLNDPNAVDVPQTISVTVQIGGGVPDRVDLLLPPGGSSGYEFRSGCAVTWSAASPAAQGPSLSLAMEGTGSFTFLCHYTLTASAAPNTANGDYNGSFTVNGSGFSPDNRTVLVTLRVTSQPIAQASPGGLRFRIAQRTPAQTQPLQVSNLGLGTLTVATVTVPSTASGWLSATSAGPLIQVTADPGGLAPGVYSGTIAVGTNASNGTVMVPVELDVLTPGPAVVPFGSVVDNATFSADDPLPPGGIAALFGDQLTAGPPRQAAVVPLDTNLGGTSVFVNNIAAPLFYVSANQVDFQIPFGVPAGDASLRVDRDGLRGNNITIQIVDRSPRILTLPGGDYAIAVNSADQSFVIPARPGMSGGHPAKPGDTITIYAIGLGATSPAVPSGAAAPSSEPLARVSTPLLVYFNRGIFTNYVSVVPQFAGLTPGFVGLYQVNVVVPAEGPKGDAVPLYLLFPFAESNHVNIALQ